MKTFRKAFEISAAKPTTIRFKDCKGNFSTCDACANIENARAQHKRGESEFHHITSFREILDGYERVHNHQQEDEREFAELNKIKAREDLDEYYFLRQLQAAPPQNWYGDR